MRLRFPWRACSWAKTAAKPAVSSSATGTRAPSSRFLAELTAGPARSSFPPGERSLLGRLRAAGLLAWRPLTAGRGANADPLALFDFFEQA